MALELASCPGGRLAGWEEALRVKDGDSGFFMCSPLVRRTRGDAERISKDQAELFTVFVLYARLCCFSFFTSLS